MVIKRTGEKVEFDRTKVINAITKACTEVDPTFNPYSDIEYIADLIEKQHDYFVSQGKDISVEEIQDTVESYLMAMMPNKVAKAYIRYRYKREVARGCSDEFIASIKEKLEATNIQNQNANIDEHSFGGRIGEASNELMKRYALDYCLSEKARTRHLNNEIYIHDLNAYAVGEHNCLSIPFDDILAKGFNTRQTDVRPAGSVNTAFQLVAVIFQLQSLQQFG